jgi:uncharacterized protein
VHVAVLSDTHGPRFWKTCPDDVAERLRRADVILHAGDVCTVEVLEELSGFAPVHVVLGNNDQPEVAAWGATPELHLDLDGLAVAMLHDSGGAFGRDRRMRRRFPDADLVVFGHSHIPWNVSADGQRCFNPGSPTDRRREPRTTMGLLEIDDGQLTAARVVPVG